MNRMIGVSYKNILSSLFRWGGKRRWKQKGTYRKKKRGETFIWHHFSVVKARVSSCLCGNSIFQKKKKIHQNSPSSRINIHCHNYKISHDSAIFALLMIIIVLCCIVVGSRQLMPPDALLIVQTLAFSRSYLHRQVSPPETLVVKGGTTWARNGRWILPENARLPCNIQGFFTCRKSTTWDRRLYFPSEERRAEDFFALKNLTASAGFEPANVGTKGQHATSRPS